MHSLAMLSAALHCDWLNTNVQTAGVAESWKKLDGLNFSLATGKNLSFFDVICGCPLDH